MSRLSRLERGEGIFKEIEVAALLDLYEVEDTRERQRVLRWTRDSKATVWWQPFSNVVPEDLELFIALESEAYEIRYFSTMFPPALLQTREYARATISQYVENDPRLLEALVDLRLQRARILSAERQEPLQLKVVLAEELLHRELQDAHVMREQLQHLIDRSQEPNIDLRILQISTPRRIANATFTHFIPRDPDDWEVVNEEGNYSDHWFELSDAVSRFREIWENLCSISLRDDTARNAIEGILRSTQEAD